MNLFDVSVIVTTYNPQWYTLEKCLTSVLKQREINYEIIIADDGSKNSFMCEIENFFKQNGFTNYKLITHKSNVGTLNNFLDGIKVSTGKYIRGIAPGDFFYDENTLKNFFIVAEKYNACVVFAPAIYYSYKNNEIKIYDKINHPMDLRPYLINDRKKIKNNYYIKNDFITGASVFYNREKIYFYLNEIKDIVKYCEDMSIIYMITQDETIVYSPDFYSYWYEYGTGISSSKNNEWLKLLEKDQRNIFTLLGNKKLIPKSIQIMNGSLNKWKRYFFRLLIDPTIFFTTYLYKVKLKGLEKNKYDITLLQKYLKDN